jgi:predicted CXXCH cytochrome family protein
MPVNRSPDLCGRCHSDTRFGWQEWKVSTHYQRGMDCVTCHDPHSASLKKVSAPAESGSPTDEVSQLCINCHKEYSMNFSYTTHHQQGISCVDCHVKHIENDQRAAHTVPDHSFQASLASCNTCHAQQMHNPTQVLSPAGTSAPASAQAEIKLASVTPQPDPVSPVGFSLIAGLIGLAGGMVLAPWLERWYRRNVKHTSEDEDE